MAIRDEKTSTELLLKDARYHRAALTTTSETTELASAVEEAEDILRGKAFVTAEKEDDRIVAQARTVRFDDELDDIVRKVEMYVLIEVDKRRDNPKYRACFPRGLTYLTAVRGDDQLREIENLTNALGANYPDLAERFSPLLRAAAASLAEAEAQYRDAAAEATVSFRDEVLARIDLVRQLQRNEGALLSLYPGERRRVRTFYRRTGIRRAVTEDGEE